MQDKIKFLIDECVLGKTKKLLEKQGYVAISIQELDKASATNGEVVSLAKNQDAILITNDLDFANLILYPLGTHPGIIVLRLRSETPESIDKLHEVLLHLLKEAKPADLKKSLTIVDPNKYRIRRD